MSTKPRPLATFSVFLLVVAVTAWSGGRAHADTGMPSGKENTSIIAQNAGDEDAVIVMDVFRADGTIIPGATRTEENVSPGGTRNFPQVTNDGLPIGFRGLGVLSSTQPVNALVVRDILDTTGRKSYSIASGAAAGGATLVVPIAFNELLTRHWNSRIAVVNAGTTAACIKVSYALIPNRGGAATTKQTVVDQPAGKPGCPGGGYPVPVSGQITFGRTGDGITRFPQDTDNNWMSAQIDVINADGTNNVAANVDIYRSDGNRLLGSYEALAVNNAAPTTDDVGTEVIIPLAIKSQSGYYTVIGVQNTTGVAADVMVRYIGTAGNTPVDFTKTLKDVDNVASHSVYESPEIPLGFIGYARITSAQPLGAIFIRGKQTFAFSGVNADTYSAGRGVPVDQADTDWNIPLIFRRFRQDGSHWGYNSWIQVQVADGSTTNVTLRFVGDPVFGGTCPVGPYETTVPVTGSKVFLMNANTDNGFPAGNSPSCFFGGATVSATKPVIVISNVTSDLFSNSDSDGLFNAFRN